MTKTVGTAITGYAYDANDQLAAEYGSTQPVANGPLYVTMDHLGSTRLVTDASGTPKQCFDYLPFGEEIASGTFGRGSCYPTGMYPVNPSPDNVDDKFTGKERDAETGLDFFESRYYSSAQGRFTSPDESKGGFLDAFSGREVFQRSPLPYADITDPQTLHKYAYVRNNPLRYTDPNGHCLEDACVIEGAIAITAFKVTADAIAYLQSPQGQESTRAFIQGTALLINKAADAISSVFRSEARPGTLGKPDHEQTVEEEADRVKGRAEVPIKTPGGAKEGRRADAVGSNPQTGAPEIVQVYRPTPAGNIPKREKEAAADIENATGVKPTMVRVRPLHTPKQPCTPATGSNCP